MHHLSTRTIFTLLGLWLSFLGLIAAYDGSSCCTLAKEKNSFANTPAYPLPPNPVCGQVYGNHTAAPKVYVAYNFCRENCAGIGLSKLSDPGQWAGPIVQFVLPAVIFSATVPRRRLITFKNSRAILAAWMRKSSWGRHAFTKIITWLPRKSLEMFIVFVDNLIWIFMIVVGAGPMLIGGLYEAVLDHLILQSIRRSGPQRRQDRRQDEKDQQELLTILALGNLEEQGDPIRKVIERLSVNNSTDDEKRRSQARLISLLRAQADFGTAIGAPVLFYLGAFIYTILDLQSDPSDQDSAISLAYGVEWMVIVHVAIVSGCLLAANNPATSTAIVGEYQGQARGPPLPPVFNARGDLRDPVTLRIWYLLVDPFIHLRTLIVFYCLSDAYEGIFQPVWMWRRGSEKRRKIMRSGAWNQSRDPDKQEILKLTLRSWSFIWVFAVILVALPPAAGAVVSYSTPPIGWSCRSLSFIIYAGCQIILCTTYTCRQRWAHEPVGERPWYKRVLAHNIWNALPLLFSGFCCIGGTVMQTVGVFRNCFCYVITNKWLNLDEAYVNLASDTEEARNSTRNWITMGVAATLFMVATSWLGWLYQRSVRNWYLEAVHNLYAGEPVELSWAERTLAWLSTEQTWSRIIPNWAESWTWMRNWSNYILVPNGNP